MTRTGPGSFRAQRDSWFARVVRSRFHRAGHESPHVRATKPVFAFEPSPGVGGLTQSGKQSSLAWLQATQIA